MTTASEFARVLGLRGGKERGARLAKCRWDGGARLGWPEDPPTDADVPEHVGTVSDGDLVWCLVDGSNVVVIGKAAG